MSYHGVFGRYAMYVEHDSFRAPGYDEILWRYMDFTKFVSMLDSGSLYFTRADKFEDKFEGVYPKRSISNFSGAYAQKLIESGSSKDEAEVRVRSALEHFSLHRATIAVNCWHKNIHESAAMWKLYLSSSEGVAVKTRFSRLKDSFPAEGSEVNIGEVSYLDYDAAHIDFKNAFEPFLCKRMSFEHEKEVRAVIWRSDLVGKKLAEIDEEFGHGLEVPCDIRLLIEEIYVSPTSMSWFKKLVESVAAKFDIDARVRQSRLNEVP